MNSVKERPDNMMDRLYKEYGHSLIIGHRGYAKDMDFHRNTLDAFKYAIESGAHGIEMDLRLTKDEQVVIHHNPWVRSGKDIGRIRGNTYDKLVQIKGNQSEVPLIDDILEFVPEDRIIFLQIKNSDSVDRILAHLQSIAKNPEQIFIMSYLSEILKGSLPTNFTYGKHYLFPLKRNLKYVLDRRSEGTEMSIASPMWNLMTKSHIDLIHELNLQSVVFTINPEKGLRKFIDYGVHAIYTDSTRQALKLL